MLIPEVLLCAETGMLCLLQTCVLLFSGSLRICGSLVAQEYIRHGGMHHGGKCGTLGGGSPDHVQ
jgi:hypothetical protein